MKSKKLVKNNTKPVAVDNTHDCSNAVIATLAVISTIAAAAAIVLCKLLTPGKPEYGDCYKLKDDFYTYARVTRSNESEAVGYSVVEGYYIYGEATLETDKIRSTETFNSLYEKVSSCEEFYKFEGIAKVEKLEREIIDLKLKISDLEK